MVLYVLMFKILEETGRQNIVNRMVANIPQIHLFLISSWIQFWFVTLVPKF